MNKHIAVILYLIMDILWITTHKELYSESIKQIQNKDMKVKILPAFFAYVLLVFNIYFLLLPRLQNKWEFALSGMVIYGVYNMTNLATLEDYTPYVALVDTSWGTLSHYILGSLVF